MTSAGTASESAFLVAAPPYVPLTRRPRPPRDWRLAPWVLLVVIAGYAAVAWLWYVSSRVRRVASPASISVFFIDAVPAHPPPPELLPPPLPRVPTPARGARTAPHGRDAITVTFGPAPRLNLYTRDGQVRAAPPVPPGSGVPAYRTPPPQGASILAPRSPITYKPTRFNKDWAPDHQTLLGRTVGRAIGNLVDKTTTRKAIKLPGGKQIHCRINPLLLQLGCGNEPPPAPSAKYENDPRLSLPPVETVTGDKVPQPAASRSATAPPSAATH